MQAGRYAQKYFEIDFRFALKFQPSNFAVRVFHKTWDEY